MAQKKDAADLLKKEKEIESLIWYFCDNTKLTIPEIANQVNKELKVCLKRTDVYPYLREAARSGRLRYQPASNAALARAVESCFEGISVEVVDTALLDHVAYQAAMLLVRLIEESAARKDAELTLGFSGGYTTKKTVQALASLLTRPTVNLPEKLVFVALVAGFDPATPGSDPTSVFTYLDVPELYGKVFFRLLYAAPVRRPSEREQALLMPGVRETAAAAKHVDIIVTSVAEHERQGEERREDKEAFHDHGMLAKYYGMLGKGLVSKLEEREWIGDMLWQPVSSLGPIKMSDLDFEALSLVRLEEFPSLIKQNKMILLVAGPCGYPGCQRRKDRIVKAVLRNGLASHAVIDSRTAMLLTNSNQPS